MRIIISNRVLKGSQILNHLIFLCIVSDFLGFHCRGFAMDFISICTKKIFLQAFRRTFLENHTHIIIISTLSVIQELYSDS